MSNVPVIGMTAGPGAKLYFWLSTPGISLRLIRFSTPPSITPERAPAPDAEKLRLNSRNSSSTAVKLARLPRTTLWVRTTVIAPFVTSPVIESTVISISKASEAEGLSAPANVRTAQLLGEHDGVFDG
jgi:hypothetical protein